MAFFVRKIEKAKWADPKPDNPCPVPADAMTLCLRTKSNELSVWEIPDAEPHSVGLAELALAGAQENCQTFHYVIVDEESLKNLGLELKMERGSTRIDSLNDSHRNIVLLDHESLTRFALYLRDRIASGQFGFVTTGGVKQKIRNALEEGLVEEDKLHYRMRDDLKLSVKRCGNCNTALD